MEPRGKLDSQITTQLVNAVKTLGVHNAWKHAMNSQGGAAGGKCTYSIRSARLFDSAKFRSVALAGLLVIFM